MYKKNTNKIIGNVIFFVIIVVIVLIFYKIYSNHDFNGYGKLEYYPNKTKFERDSKEKYSKKNSYKITSEEYNDAVFYKTIKVEKNTVYKVTCKVKTENIKTQKESSNGGAQISIVDTTEKSKAIIGTNNWQEIQLLFDSKEREEIKLGFRLGGYDDNCIGTAWFSDFTIESGVKDTSSEWNIALFICESIDANIEKDGNKENIKISMSSEDKQLMREDFERFGTTIEELSGSQIKVNTYIYEITEPLTNLSYNEENEYYISAKDVESLIDKQVQENEFDHIFIATRFGDLKKNIEIPTKDWIGLGYMDYYGIGFSNIRLPNSVYSNIYKYGQNNTFPEEIFVHEFIHSLERNLNERNYDIPALHDYNNYGYLVDKVEGLKKWYSDYMQKKIKTSNGYIGLDSDVYKIKPIKESCFENSTKLNYFE